MRAKQTASDILKREDVQEYLNKRLRALGMGVDEALYRLSGHARGNITQFLGLTVDELKAHPNAWMIKRVKIGVHYREKMTDIPAPQPLAVQLFEGAISKLRPRDEGESDSEEPVESALPESSFVYFVESVELYDAQSAILNIIKQNQLTNGLPTEIVAMMPTLTMLIDVLRQRGEDPAEIFNRMFQRLAAEG